MKIDLHIHTKTYSDGNLHLEEVFQEATRRNVDLMSTTDHDSIGGQEKAIALARQYVTTYITGVELNIAFQHPSEPGRSISLDFLGYQYDIGNQELKSKLEFIRERRELRAREILDKLNIEFDKENITRFDEEDIKKIQDRLQARDMARKAKADVAVVECVLDEGAVKTRLEKRLQEETTSDGRWEIYGSQEQDFDPITEFSQQNHILLDTSQPTSIIVEAISDVILKKPFALSS